MKRRPPKSLFIVGLPRSLTTTMHHVSARAVGLESPSWTGFGEILNIDQMVAYRGPRFDENSKYTTRENYPKVFAAVTDFLDHVTIDRGFAYKDVIEPFVISSWRGLRRLKVLRIKRDIADVAFSVIGQGWQYPMAAAIRTGPEYRPFDKAAINSFFQGRLPTDKIPALDEVPSGDRVRVLVKCLMLADLALNEVSATELLFDDIVAREEPLWHALQVHYPMRRISKVRYINPMFAADRDRILRRRETLLHRWLRDIVDTTQVIGPFREPGSDPTRKWPGEKPG